MQTGGTQRWRRALTDVVISAIVSGIVGLLIVHTAGSGSTVAPSTGGPTRSAVVRVGGGPPPAAPASESGASELVTLPLRLKRAPTGDSAPAPTETAPRMSDGEYYASYVIDPFTDQSRDAAWANDTENVLLNQFNTYADSAGTDFLASVEIDALECRSSMCHISLRYHDASLVEALQTPLYVGLIFDLDCVMHSIGAEAAGADVVQELYYACKR
jgi:hypothetical protein